MKKNLFLVSLCLVTISLKAQDDPAPASDLEKQIQNPVASLISVPFQNNTDFGIGSFDGTRNTLNIQPVIPFSISDGLNMITRTIIPIISQPINADDKESGIGDINLSLFLTPAKPSKVIYGGGIALGIPTASNQFLGTEKWSAGPSFVVLTQPEGWTIGALAQNTWSFAGDDNRGDVNFFFSQIFVTRNLPKGWYLNSAPIITANWEASDGNKWTIPLGAGFGKLFRLGKLPVNAQMGYYSNVVKPDFGPDSQLRFQIVLLFPK